ncbi:MAG: hypothetical protein E7399_05870 [Ruminococcaceae bacterium]|nr:hypothetical protein [Oscillospiraceae bacterium]
MKNHSLSLPDWGPYNKVYTGVSHIFDREEGIRFDVDIFPGFYRRSVMCPKTVADCGAHSWKASEDGRSFAYRYELERKDRVYLDAEFTVSDDNCLMELTFVNRTELPQSVQADLCFSLRYPSFLREEFQEYQVIKPDSVDWVKAVDYQDICCQQENACDGLRRGEMLGHGFTGKRGIDPKYFGEEGTKLTYRVSKPIKQIGIRYQAKQDVLLTLVCGETKQDVTLSSTENQLAFAVFSFEAEGEELHLCPHGGGLMLDGIALSEKDDLSLVSFLKKETPKQPNILTKEKEMILQYGEKSYTIKWDYDLSVIRKLYCSDAGRILPDKIHDHVSTEFFDGSEGFFTDLFLRPVFLEPEEEKKICLTLSLGKEETVQKSEYFSFHCNQDGAPYLFSQNLAAAVTMLNVVYPVFCKGGWIKHSCPGRVWDSLYTWDSGMIGTGLSAISLKRAEENLNAYLVEPDDPDCAFIMHGSTVATQMFLFLELWQKSLDETLIKRYYPSMKRYYQFYSDKKKVAPKTGLLQPWNQFYNSGGWDDYPPQQYMHDNQMEGSVSPVITTAMTVLFAKIMLLFAPDSDKELFQSDIEYFTRALENAWDEESGYYGYVLHDARGEKKDIVRTPDGENYNKGLDGLYPYLIDLVPEHRKERMLKHIKQGLMTKVGMSVVDSRASYFRKDGYWNGSVWMPHQWIVSKALLDLGNHDLSFEIAKKGLELWKRETDDSYNCYEHFMIENGRGAGFHQFSGLSSPVMKWFETYYVPGNVTCGFQTKILKKEWNEEFTALHLEVEVFSKQADVIVCMNDKKEYSVQNATKITDGAYCIRVEQGIHHIQVI